MSKKNVSDEELAQLLEGHSEVAKNAYDIKEMQVISGNGRNRVASLTLYDNHAQTIASYTGLGTGAVESLIGCIKQAMPFEVRLVELEVHSMFNGEASSEAAEGEAEVTIEINGQMFIANATDQDIVFAAAKAFLGACNRAVMELELTPIKI